MSTVCGLLAAAQQNKVEHNVTLPSTGNLLLFQNERPMMSKLMIPTKIRSKTVAAKSN